MALGVAGALLFRGFLFEGIYVASDSMSPILPVGTNVFVNKWVYRFQVPERGEIVSFSARQTKGKGMVKRVIAVGGDTLELRDKQVHINGQPLEEPYVQHVRADTLLVGDNVPPMRVPDGHVYLMGDNRDVSGDSRDWVDIDGRPDPFIPVGAIEGRVSKR